MKNEEKALGADAAAVESAGSIDASGRQEEKLYCSRCEREFDGEEAIQVSADWYLVCEECHAKAEGR